MQLFVIHTITVSLIVCFFFAITVEEGDYFEGDIRLRPGEDPYNIFYRWLLPRTARSLETSNMMSSRVWPGGRIPYKFHRDLGEYDKLALQ